MTNTTEAEWRYSDRSPEGVVLDTLGPGGLEQRLKREGNLWFFPDGSMYVYYTPVAWRYVEGV